jgi:hypothetical protein
MSKYSIFLHNHCAHTRGGIKYTAKTEKDKKYTLVFYAYAEHSTGWRGVLIEVCVNDKNCVKTRVDSYVWTPVYYDFTATGESVVKIKSGRQHCASVSEITLTECFE